MSAKITIKNEPLSQDVKPPSIPNKQNKCFHKIIKKTLETWEENNSAYLNEECIVTFNKKHTDTLCGRTRTRPQETLEFILNKQMETLSFSPPINLFEEGKCFLGLTSFQATNSVFNETNENNSFSLTKPGFWSSRGGAASRNRQWECLALRAQNDFELHVEEVRKRGNERKIGDKECKLSDFDNRGNDMIEELKTLECEDLENMVFGMELTYSEIENILDWNIVMHQL